MVFSNLGTCWLVLKTHNARAVPGKLPGSTGRRRLTIRAEVKYVTAEEAKELVAVDGYSVLDVRDKTQFERAHIKTCSHVPLFVENQDNDLGMEFLSFQNSSCVRIFSSWTFFITSVFITFILSVGTIIKRTVHNNFSGLFFGLPFTKPNPDFLQTVKSQFQPESKLLVVCQEGMRLVYDFLPNCPY